jgi:hypothetical protein
VSALATEERPQAEHVAPQLFEASGSTLEEHILGAWEALRLNGRTECPVCGGGLTAAGCADCGSQLS